MASNKKEKVEKYAGKEKEAKVCGSLCYVNIKVYASMFR
jgi:hypothetical protein